MAEVRDDFLFCGSSGTSAPRRHSEQPRAVDAAAGPGNDDDAARDAAPAVRDSFPTAARAVDSAVGTYSGDDALRDATPKAPWRLPEQPSAVAAAAGACSGDGTARDAAPASVAAAASSTNGLVYTPSASPPKKRSAVADAVRDENERPSTRQRTNQPSHQQEEVACRGVYDGNFGPALSFAGRTMINTGRKLVEMASGQKAGLELFAKHYLAKTRDFFEPYRGMIMERAASPEDGFVFRREGCTGTCSERSSRCDVCAPAQANSKRYISRSYDSNPVRPHSKTKIEVIAGSPRKARIEIESLREENKRLKRENAKKVFLKDLGIKGRNVSQAKLAQIRKALGICGDEVETALEEGGAEEEVEMWKIFREHINEVYTAEESSKGRNNKKKRVKIREDILDWAIAFLAKTSISTYNEVRKVLKLPHISYVYKKTAEMVSSVKDKAWAVNIDTIKSLAERATKEDWTEHQRRGVLAQDSANVSTCMEFDHVSNTLIGGDESHRLGSLTHTFHTLAQQVRDAAEEEGDNAADGGASSEKVRLQPIYLFLLL